jgi:nucleoside-diphosphate-sugar epimerase
MILITGATGRIGGATRKQLSNRGVLVRVLLRTPEKAAVMRERLLASGVPEWHVDVQVDFSTALSAQCRSRLNRYGRGRGRDRQAATHLRAVYPRTSSSIHRLTGMPLFT